MQKTAPTNTKSSRIETILKIGHHAKAIARAKPHIESKIKIQKSMSKFILQIVLCKKPLKKTPNIREMRPF